MAADSREKKMFDMDTYRRIPGLFRLWDLQFVIRQGDECRVSYAETTEDGTPLFAVLRRVSCVPEVAP